jgi:hypothetical protein
MLRRLYTLIIINKLASINTEAGLKLMDYIIGSQSTAKYKIWRTQLKIEDETGFLSTLNCNVVRTDNSSQEKPQANHMENEFNRTFLKTHAILLALET